MYFCREAALTLSRFRCIKAALYAHIDVYSYPASDGTQRYVLKQIHHEPCDYYQFGNKVEAEINDYNRLKEIGIKIPAMIDVDQLRSMSAFENWGIKYWSKTPEFLQYAKERN